jgi:hypothetical protein
MNALIVKRWMRCKIASNIAMFTNHGPAIALSYLHGEVKAGKDTIHLKVFGLQRPAYGIARKGNDANKRATSIIFDGAPERVKTFRKSSDCFHLIIFLRFCGE